MVYLVTGANGFIGRALVNRLRLSGCSVRGSVRFRPFEDHMCVGDIGPNTDWSSVLCGVDTVIHCAARAHILKETSQDPLGEYRRVNVAGARRLAEQAANFGTRRLVFLSTIGVNGISTDGRSPFTECDPAMPQDDYGRSKWEAEVALKEVSAGTGLEIVIVRSPLVYGAGVQANFLRLMKLIRTGLPLPFASVKNRRSLIGIDNLVDFLCHCSTHPLAANETFLVSDGADVSTPDLVRRIAEAMNRSASLVPMPVSILGLFGRLVGLSSEIGRLAGSLQVDIHHARRTLGWQPPLSLEEGLRRTVFRAC